jgi:hypothetical protein
VSTIWTHFAGEWQTGFAKCGMRAGFAHWLGGYLKGVKTRKKWFCKRLMFIVFNSEMFVFVLTVLTNVGKTAAVPASLMS